MPKYEENLPRLAYDVISYQQKLLVTHRRTLAPLVEQEASTHLHTYRRALSNGIIEARGHIRRIKGILRARGVVDDQPNDGDDSNPSA
jgi:hypothetical protein